MTVLVGQRRRLRLERQFLNLRDLYVDPATLRESSLRLRLELLGQVIQALRQLSLLAWRQLLRHMHRQLDLSSP